MLNLIEKFDPASRHFWESQRRAGLTIPTVVMHDNGFLPDEVDSPIKFFGRYDSQRPPLYFDRLPVPAYWRVVGDQQAAAIYQLSEKRADIVYWQPENRQRTVQLVQWRGRGGDILWVDHYNRHSYRFARTVYDHQQPTLRQYFAADGSTFLTINLLTGTVALIYQQHRHFFNDYVEFVRFYLELRGYPLDQILYNTLNESYRLALSLSAAGQDTLFWHEPVKGELPGNMVNLMQNQTRTRHIVFQRYRDWQRYRAQLTSSQVDFHYLGMVYPVKRQNQDRPRALIATNSDQLEQLTTLVQELPEVHFDIMAVTEMSAKLLAFRKFANVSLYPNVTDQQAARLWQAADFFLDINHGAEILQALRRAFEENQLILGFDSTLHAPQLVSPANVFAPKDAAKLAQQIRVALASPTRLQELLTEQRQLASAVTAEDYQQLFNIL
ncbi:accessory Sec system glycosylation chaperone GtfB [Limosilactobacillus sp.]|jgi:accessory Sec system glycosyltransferase GtfB|uniref:accessory Sec system glycosylation chaperone GtfB n=1 Tax=Limosilactobacillus sp. TaxID=2773925 RepID=UPI0025BD1D95|nr:accessory Sec system glycosylation chaperone GtfB [Limosilactobacillus sp.]MCH3922669.1 accessory Sec system glycosylation chaperone GtfB [Limosilactobacillus sp.]MCH3927352.1 accessory Sec system glycosylation chaperone GtfB [Limosilactobacillus sp.]